MVACARKKKKRKDRRPHRLMPQSESRHPENIVIGLQKLRDNTFPDGPIALDCEMVGIGDEGKKSALARISIVDHNLDVLYDVISRPDEEIIDYRTPYSGIRPSDMERAIPFESVKDQVQRIVKDRVVVGHMLHHDFDVLKFKHPKHLIRDTGKAPYAKRRAGVNLKRPVSLQHLTRVLLGVQIQNGEHSSVEDAQATMGIYRLVEREWEADLRDQAAKRAAKKRRNEARDSNQAQDPPPGENGVSLSTLLDGDKYWGDIHPGV